MRALAFVVLLAACGDNVKPHSHQQDAGTHALAPCLDEPGAPLRPPTEHLPCELLPPGFVAP